MRHVIIVSSAFCFALLLTGKPSGETLVLDAVLALASLGWSALGRSTARRSIAAPPRGQWGAWRRAVGALPGDMLRVGAALGRALLGTPAPWRAVEARFRFGRERDPHEAGRRAVAVIAGSLTPDRIVVDLCPGRPTASTHRLAGGGPVDAEWLA